MRTLTVALIAAAALSTAVAATGASAADTAAAAAKALPGQTAQQAQYYPDWGYRGYPYYRHHHQYWRDRYYYGRGWRYSEAEELNRQELNRLGVAP